MFIGTNGMWMILYHHRWAEAIRDRKFKLCRDCTEDKSQKRKTPGIVTPEVRQHLHSTIPDEKCVFKQDHQIKRKEESHGKVHGVDDPHLY